MSRFRKTEKVEEVSQRKSLRKDKLEPGYEEYERWLSKLKKGVDTYILSHLDMTEKDREHYLSDNSMILWASTFTDTSKSGSSYERYESIGDSVVKPLLFEHALRQDAFIMPDQLSNLANYYLSNAYQARLISNYKTDKGGVFVKKHVLMKKSGGFEFTQGIYGDFYEAIMGSIFLLGNKLQIGKGYYYCAKWFEHIFISQLPMGKLEEKRMKKLPSLVLDDLFSRFSYYRVHIANQSGSVKFETRKTIVPYIKDTTSTQVKYTISWSNSVREFLKLKDVNYVNTKTKNSIPSNNSVIAEATNPIEEDAIFEASEKALKVLEEKYGITDEWMSEKKDELDKMSLAKDLGAVYTKLETYCKEKSYTKLRFENYSKHAQKGNRTALGLLVNDGKDIVELYAMCYTEGDAYLSKQLLIKECVEELVKQGEI